MRISPRMPWPFSWYYYKKKAMEYKRRFPGARISAYSIIPDRNVSIGRGTYGRPTILTFTEDDRVEIGNYTSIGPDVMIVAGGNHDFSKVSTYPLKQLFGGGEAEAQSKGPVIIGSDVWIGARVVILSGVTIGNGAVIAAGSVVTGSIPCFTVVAGIPAKVIKERFPQAIRDKMEAIAWWEWPESKIIDKLESFDKNPALFIKKEHR